MRWSTSLEGALYTIWEVMIMANRVGRNGMVLSGMFIGALGNTLKYAKASGHQVWVFAPHRQKP